MFYNPAYCNNIISICTVNIIAQHYTGKYHVFWANNQCSTKRGLWLCSVEIRAENTRISCVLLPTAWAVRGSGDTDFVIFNLHYEWSRQARDKDTLCPFHLLEYICSNLKFRVRINWWISDGYQMIDEPSQDTHFSTWHRSAQTKMGFGCNTLLTDIQWF